MKQIKDKELDKAMEEMECWLVQNHLKKCEKCKSKNSQSIYLGTIKRYISK